MMAVTETPTLSICLTCRDRREDVRGDLRGGARLAMAVGALAAGQDPAAIPTAMPARLRGVRCMSQCKRACVVSLTAPGAFTYVFGDLDPENPAHLQAVLDLIPLYLAAPEGFLRRDQRPEALRASILGRLPPLDTCSDLVAPILPEQEPLT